MKIPNKLKTKLDKRCNEKIYRKLEFFNSFKKDYFSNDYLGYAKEKFPSFSDGSSGSRLISGTKMAHLILEKECAVLHKSEASLLFNSGYDANIGFFSEIPQKGDIVLYDEWIHASIRDGMRLSLAKNYRFKHNDLEDLERKIKQYQSEEIIYVVVESIYSMDGDSPDFDKLKVLVKKYGIYLIIDEAHSLGVFGEKGLGLSQKHELQEFCFARLYTFGKALGLHGAIWVGSNELINFLINYARSFIYTTALPSSVAEEIYKKYQIMMEDSENRILLSKNINYFHEIVKKEDLEVFFSLNNSPIQSFFGETKEELIQLSNELERENYLVKPIFSPTVPKGEERLRISLHSFNTFEEIEKLIVLIKNFKFKKR